MSDVELPLPSGAKTFPYVDGHPHKPLMEHEELRDAINLSLWAGQLLLQHGADSGRVEETIHRLGTGLGCDWMDIIVLPVSISATTSNNQEFRTRVRRAPTRGVNMTMIAEISDLSFRVQDGELNRFQLREEIHRIIDMQPQYGRWTVVLAVGIACAAFCRLFGGDEGAMLTTFGASAAAMFIRQELHHHHLNWLLSTVLVAMMAGIGASAASVFDLSAKPEIALTAAVLLLVPGVQLINSTEDLIRGYPLTGIARGFNGLLVSLAIALGLALAIWLTGSRYL